MANRCAQLETGGLGAAAWRATGRADAETGSNGLDQIVRHFGNKARGSGKIGLAVGLARFGVGDVEPLHGSRHADIAQAPLLGQPAGLLDRFLVWKKAFFHAGQKHQREFQPLGRVQGHQLYAVLPALGLMFAGLECRLRQERGHGAQARLFVFEGLIKTVRGAHQFGEVFLPRLGAIGRLAALIPGNQFGLAHHHADHFGQVGRLGGIGQLLDQLQEGGRRTRGPRRQSALRGQFGGRLAQRLAMTAGVLADAGHRLLTDTARRHVDDALECGVVVRIVNQAQVGHRILDFGALEKAQAAVDAIGDVGAQKGLFEEP